MRRLVHKLQQDGMSLRILARNTKAGSYPELKGKFAEITAAYLDYVSKNGCAVSIQPLAMSAALKKRLIYHYDHPPKSHSFIGNIRDNDEAATCPMCGSSSCGTLDHVLPKEHFPEFSLYSRNLVPACMCNLKRGSAFKGQGNARVLHPYFDTILSERLVGCAFSDHGEAPALRIVNLLASTHPMYGSVQFHIESIILKTMIKSTLRKDWGRLMRKPSTIIRELRRTPGSQSQLKDILESELATLDDSHESLNNWSSIFVGGLLRPDTLRWLHEQMTRRGRGDDDPIIAQGNAAEVPSI